MSGMRRCTQLLLSVCLLFLGTATFAQETPSDYQEVLKSLEKGFSRMEC